MSTSASRNENRLTDEDRAAMHKRVSEVVAHWPAAFAPSVSDLLALERVAMHAIGCSSYDLRGSELDEIARMVRRFKP